jgi:hypothetical protein
MSDELKSRFQELYPMHPCESCGLEHVRIPTITTEGEVNGEKVEIPWVPFEVVGMIEGSARPGAGADWDTPAHIQLLFWGPPGAQQASAKSILYMN